MTTLYPINIASDSITLGNLDPAWALTEPDGLSNGVNGRRVYEKNIYFAKPFTCPPVVQVSIAGFDISNAANARLRVRALEVQNEGFVLEVETWLNTVIWSVNVSWMAIGT